MNEADIFIGALQHADEAERRAYLDAACAHGYRPAWAMQALLDVNARAGSFLEKPAVEPALPERPPRRPPRIRPKGTKALEGRSARTSCCSRSARAAWAPSSWPSRPTPVRP